MIILGYVLSAVISPLVSWAVAHFTKSPELGVTVGGGVAAVGTRLAHVSEPPKKTP